jgi:signal transduction histidine kinase
VADFAGERGIEVTVRLSECDAALDDRVATAVFRIVQEALTNVVRHAGSAAARVTLRQMSGGLLLAVRDDGVGFDMERMGEGRRLGLASMRERVQLVNGTLDIESAPGRGTTVVAWVPTEGDSA